MEGFFYSDEEKKKKVARISRKGSGTRQKKQGCEACGLSKTCNSPKMPYSGKGKKKILVIGEAPGATEDEKGTQFVGDAGKTLRRKFASLGIDLDRDCWKTNAIICRPPKNATPKSRQISLCFPHLEKTILELKPKKIITFGKTPLQSFLLGRESVKSVESWVGWTIPDQKYKCWVFPNYHPQYLNYNADDIILHKLFDKYLKQAIEWDKEFPDNHNDIKDVRVIKDLTTIILYLQSIKPGMQISFDIETTGRKPFVKGHKIKTMSIALGKHKCFAFPFMAEEEAFIRQIRRIMTDSEIEKIGQNLKYEDLWLRVLHDIEVKGWIFDTMLGIHVLDNRSGITGLKFQTYIYEGVSDYSKEVKKYLEAAEKDGNAFNQIDKVDIDKLLLYNGLDSLYTFRLYRRYKRMMRENDWQAYQLLHDGAIELSRIEYNGISADMKYYETEFSHLGRRMKKIHDKIMDSKEVQIWKTKAPGKFAKEKFNFNSATQLRILLFDLLNYPVGKMTKSENPSADQEVLEGIDKPFVKNILAHRKLKKIKDTYLQGFMREQSGGIIHPSFNLNIVRTYRSSSNNPNFQNIPKHDEQAQRIVRGGLVPRKGRQLVEVDYSGMEVRISACYHKDPEMIKYIKNPETDMHRDQAAEIFLKAGLDITKRERFLAKNNFVFAEFYGDYYVHCAENIWKDAEPEILSGLNDRGIKTYSAFEKHMKKVEDKFWNKKFKVYRDWKESTWKEFQRKGYYNYYTGFTSQGHMYKNDCLNYPIQGSAFHCLLWSLIQVNKFLVKNKFQTELIGQIHDSLVFDRVPEEKDELMPAIKKIMVQDLRKAYPWIIVPLDIEVEASEINGSWANLQKEEI
jgi:uracil-DNA glycosylase family 4